MIELHGVFLVPVVHGDGAVPPHTVVKHGGGVGVVPAGGLEVEVLLKVGHPVTVRVGHGAVHAVRGQRIESVFPLPAVRQAVVVGVGVVGLSVHEVLQTIGQAVTVLVGSGLNVHGRVLNRSQR